jgi:hypothetical protein
LRNRTEPESRLSRVRAHRICGHGTSACGDATRWHDGGTAKRGHHLLERGYPASCASRSAQPFPGAVAARRRLGGPARRWWLTGPLPAQTADPACRTSWWMPRPAGGRGAGLQGPGRPGAGLSRLLSGKRLARA